MDPTRVPITTDATTDPYGNKITTVEKLFPVNKFTITCRTCEQDKPRNEFYYAPQVDRNRTVCKLCKSKETSERANKKRSSIDISDGRPVAVSDPIPIPQPMAFPPPPKLVRESTYSYQ